MTTRSRTYAVRVLLACLCALVASGCSSSDDSASDKTDDHVAFVTELMHRDAATLNLLDAALGTSLPAGLSSAVETARADGAARIETAADLLREWDEEVPVTVRDHGIDHGLKADAPELPGAPSEAEIHALSELHGADFTTTFTDLLREAMTSTTDAASTYDGSDQPTTELAEAAGRQPQSVLDALG